jgi:hypothetical protein
MGAPLTRYALQFLLASIKKIDIMAYISSLWAYSWTVLRDIYEQQITMRLGYAV